MSYASETIETGVNGRKQSCNGRHTHRFMQFTTFQTTMMNETTGESAEMTKNVEEVSRRFLGKCVKKSSTFITCRKKAVMGERANAAIYKFRSENKILIYIFSPTRQLRNFAVEKVVSMQIQEICNN